MDPITIKSTLKPPPINLRILDWAFNMTDAQLIKTYERPIYCSNDELRAIEYEIERRTNPEGTEG